VLAITRRFDDFATNAGAPAMQMHGEMMKVMGDIMLKYADKIQTIATKLPGVRVTRIVEQLSNLEESHHEMHVNHAYYGSRRACRSARRLFCFAAVPRAHRKCGTVLAVPALSAVDALHDEKHELA